MRWRLLDPLREGEPDTTVAAETSPATDAAVEPKGDDGAAAAKVEDGGEGAESSEVLVGLTPEEIAALPDDDVEAFIEVFGDRIASSKAMQERIDRAAQAKRDRDASEQRPKADPYFQNLSQTSAQANQQINDLLGKVRAGEVPDDLDQLEVHVANVAEWTEAAERRGLAMAMDAVMGRELGLDPAHMQSLIAQVKSGQTDDLDPLHVAYGTARIKLDQKQLDAHALKSDRDPKNRAKSPYADATAVASYMADVVETAKAIGAAQARAEDAKQIDKRVEHTAKLAGSNAFREALAKVSTTKAAATVGATGGLNGKGAEPDVTVEQFTAMTKETRQAFRKSRPEAYKRVHRASLGLKDEE